MTEQPIKRLRRICKIEGVDMYDGASVIKMCREYIDGDVLLAAHRGWQDEIITQAAISAGLIAKPCDGTN